MGSSSRPFGPRHLPLSAPLHENTTQMWACPAGLAFGALQMHQAPIFRSFDVRLAVSDMLRSTPTTLSVSEQVNDLYSCTVGENQGAFASDWVVEAD